MAYTCQSIPLTADLFGLAVHPSRPLLVTALASGHVYAYTTPAADDFSIADTAGNDSAAATAWKTRRHKGSCRDVAFSPDGTTLYSAGSDGLLKAACADTGRVASKALLPSAAGAAADAATTLLPLGPARLLVGTDAGNIHMYDLRTPAHFRGAAPAASWLGAHEDYISSLTRLPPAAPSAEARQFAATGDTTLSVLDVRRAGQAQARARSAPQDDELLCAALVDAAPARHRAAGGTPMLVAGTAAGVATAWTCGFWEDHQQRVPLARATGDSVDAVLALPPHFCVAGARAAGGPGAFFAAGSGDGVVRVVELGPNRVVATLAHGPAAGGRVRPGDYTLGLEAGVAALGLDCAGRIVSGGGTVVKVWSVMAAKAGAEKRGHDSDGGSGDDGGSGSDGGDDSSDEEEEGTKRRKRKRKKRKGGRGKARSAGVRNVHGFSGLD